MSIPNDLTDSTKPSLWVRPATSWRPKSCLALCVLFVCVAACSASTEPPLEVPSIPVPPWIRESTLERLPDGRTQLSFETMEAYPRSRVRDFYGEWAKEHGWTLVPEATEAWSADRWVSFHELDGTSIDQWLVHWRSPDGADSLRLALLHRGDREKQEVYVIRSPYFVLGDGDLPMDEGDFQDPSCPRGTLTEPVPRRQPLPSVELLQEHCPERAPFLQVLVSITRNGSVESVDLVEGSGCPYADDEIRRCVSQWLFDPAKCDDDPVSIERGILIPVGTRGISPSEAEPCLTEEASPG